MRIWDLPPEQLCRAHLLGEHGEPHTVPATPATRRRSEGRYPITIYG